MVQAGKTSRSLPGRRTPTAHPVESVGDFTQEGADLPGATVIRIASVEGGRSGYARLAERIRAGRSTFLVARFAEQFVTDVANTVLERVGA
jgi:hypothetical protein